MNDDIISRQAAIDAVNTALFPKLNTAKDAEKALKQLPSAERHGRWINKKNKEIGYEIWVNECSVCGGKTPVNVDRYRYCPGCGARMDEK